MQDQFGWHRNLLTKLSGLWRSVTDRQSPTLYREGDPMESVRSERGASSVEYGLLIAGIAAVIVLAVFVFGGSVSDLFSDSCDTINGPVNGSTC